MILPDHEIRKLLDKGELVVEPLEPDVQIQSAGIDLRLGNEFRIFRAISVPYVDTRKDSGDYTEAVRVKNGEPFILHPGELVLAGIKEYIKMPGFLMGSVDGRSSLGRLGITVHATSASINPGWEGRFVLEMSNMAKLGVALYPTMRVAKLTLHKLSSPAEKPYGKRGDSKYQGQDDIWNSRIHEDNQFFIK
jgi:dCTP deaminase